MRAFFRYCTEPLLQWVVLSLIPLLVRFLSPRCSALQALSSAGFCFGQTARALSALREASDLSAPLSHIRGRASMKKCGHQSRGLPAVNAELSETVGKESLMDFRPKDPIKYLENDQWIDAFVVAYAETLPRDRL